MQETISKMLDHYEHGKINRRQLIQALLVLAATGQRVAASESTFSAVAINHLAIRVANVPRSKAFYQRHLDLPVLSEPRGMCFLGVGKSFLTLIQNPEPGLDHFCFAIENFKADRVVEQLKEQGLAPKRPSGSDRIYFPDPDGLIVQLSSPDHKP